MPVDHPGFFPKEEDEGLYSLYFLFISKVDAKYFNSNWPLTKKKL